MTINELIKESHSTAVEKGWWEDRDRNFGEQLMLFITEITEVWDEIEAGMSPSDTWLVRNVDTGKPEGLASEIADLWIRAADTIGRYEIPLQDALDLVLDFGNTTPISTNADWDIAGLIWEARLNWTVIGPMSIGLLETISCISYAMEEYRTNGLDQSKFLTRNMGSGEPEGMAVHFAHMFLVTAALCQDYGIPLVKALDDKLAYNRFRPYRHGDKKA